MYFTAHCYGLSSHAISEIEMENECSSIIKNNKKRNDLHSKEDKKMTKDTRDKKKVLKINAAMSPGKVK